jgi:hypothetical protein
MNYDDWKTTEPDYGEPLCGDCGCHLDDPNDGPGYCYDCGNGIKRCDACGDEGGDVVLSDERAYLHGLDRVCAACNAAMLREEGENR